MRTHTSGKCFLPPAQQPLPGPWSSCEGNEMAAFVYLRETAESSWAWKSSQQKMLLPLRILILSSQAPQQSCQLNAARVNRHPAESIRRALVQMWQSSYDCFLPVSAARLQLATSDQHDILVTQLLVVVNKNLNWWLFLMCHWYFLTTDDQLHSPGKPSFQKICIVHCHFYVSS